MSRDPEQAYAVNATGVRNLALVTRDLGATLIHVSTDYVFDGKKRRPLYRGGCSASAECVREFQAGGRILCANDQSETFCASDLGALRETSVQSEGRTELCRSDAGVGANAGSSAGGQ